MVNGVLIDFDTDVLVHHRDIYTLTNWLSDVGGFAKAIQYVLTIIFPLVSIVDLNAFLITKLFRVSSLYDNVQPTNAITP